MVPTKAFRRSTIVRRGFGRHSRIKHTEAFHPFILSMRRLQCQVYVLEWSFRACLKIRPVGEPGLQRIGILGASCRPRALTRRWVRILRHALRFTWGLF
jgi:hypothetical protein